ncbi:glycosyl hydrolase family 95 catalytic domain-containing protein [Streptomyces sp. NPDC096311]|uniref:glycosyl hydrolase family 95 catalytic domain-containing protein n=1 Tax=Streptomyces sp. NPDC096311 TaxID=3366083 RepID=UPI003823367F
MFFGNRRARSGRRLAAVGTAWLLASATLGGLGQAQPAAAADTPTTAWHNGSFSVDTEGVVSRSDIVLGAPNLDATQYMPVGNGSLGAAVWAASGFTAQLNRVDTFPDRKSPGQVVVPGLSALTTANDYSGHLDLYDGTYRQSGGGMTATTYVRSGSDQLVVDVTGADPDTVQTAKVGLWSGRSPQAAASDGIGVLSETWKDDTATGASGDTFGSLAALTARGRDVTASVVDDKTVQVSFKPKKDGTFRIVVDTPHWAGGDALATARSDLADTSAGVSKTSAWWHKFWTNTALIKATSADGTADYMERLRTIYLYTEAAAMRGSYPGSQAGTVDLFDFSKDKIDWYPAGYWFWNLRTQVASNMTSGNYALNEPVFALYRNNLDNIKAWTKDHMGGRAGICVPETMRFNGNGYYAGNGNEGAANASCDQSLTSWNAGTITSGAEIGMWVWQQYQLTQDKEFLAANYPLMSESARFLLASATKGADGKLHVTANAHETQWNVKDPTMTLAAMKALYPAVTAAATVLGRQSADADLLSAIDTALPLIPDYPRVDAATQQTLYADGEGDGTDVIAPSYQPTAYQHNVENLGLETAWPFGLIGDSGSQTTLARRTYTNRPYVNNPDWTMDAVQAARLGLSGEVEKALIASTKKYQAYPSGMANWLGGPGDQPYIEQAAAVTAAMNEALVQSYDGTVRFAPAWPADWDVDGSAPVTGGGTAHVQVRGGTVTTAVIEAGTTGDLKVRNPWPGESLSVYDETGGKTVIGTSDPTTFTVKAKKNHDYVLLRTAAPSNGFAYAEVTGSAAAKAAHLGGVSIGLDTPAKYDTLADSYDNVGVTEDTDTAPGDFDGGGASYSSTAFTQAGATPGTSFTHSGVTFTLPASGGGAQDNAVASGQQIGLTGSGSTLGFLVSSSYGATSGTGTVVYTDGTTKSFTLSTPDWSTGDPGTADVAIASPYQNRQGNTRYQRTGYVFQVNVGLDATRTVAKVILPNVSGGVSGGTKSLHVFAMALGTS